MPGNRHFSHLSLPLLYTGKPILHGYGSSSKKTEHNRANRELHGAYLHRRSSALSRFWKERRAIRLHDNLPDIRAGIPLLLEIDPSTDLKWLKGLGFEVICEIDEGFIIVASEDADLVRFQQKIDKFIHNVSRNCNTPAKVYAMCEDTDRLKRILSKNLYDEWANISADTIYLVDVNISCSGRIQLPDKRQPKKAESEEHYASYIREWEKRFKKAYREWDELKMKREDSLRNFLHAYQGDILDMPDGNPAICKLPDSFSARLSISGKCLLDLVMNFPYIFEVSEAAKIKMEPPVANSTDDNDSINIISPSSSSPIICVIDSGIQEQHRYISPAIVSKDSVSLIPDNPSPSDEVSNGGHGTRVAGATLYPEGIPATGKYQLPFRIRNLRVLDERNVMPQNLYPPDVITKAVELYYMDTPIQTRIYNQSISGNRSCDLKRMTGWAASIDSQSYEHDILCIQAAGNVSPDLISVYWHKGCSYPAYLEEELCRIADPAQSLQALTVGSISDSDYETADWIALGKSGHVSSFSRSGPGIWDIVKPEVVECGGTHAYNKNSDPPILSTPPEVCPELIRKSPQGPPFARDQIGTSFAAPKVTYIAAQIEKILPNAPALLYRALIVQSARWPKNLNDLTDKDKCVAMLRHIGYGIPDVHRATENDDYRVTLITPDLLELGEGEAHIFRVPIPEELSSVGEDYDILVEITLSYAANPRMTRRYTKSYLSTWLDWCCSRIGERPEIFARRIFETGASIEDDGNFKWVLGESTNHGIADGYSRKKGTLQKDWCIIKSNQLNDAFCIAVRGHKGWGDLFKAKYSLVVSFEAINQDVPIYESIKNEIETEINNKEIEIEMHIDK